MSSRLFRELPIMLIIVAAVLAIVLLWAYLESKKHPAARAPSYVV